MIIALEGIDGAGKTTLINELSRYYPQFSIYSRCKKTSFVTNALNFPIIKNNYVFQMIIYTYLGRKNSRNIKNQNYILMDRCFLSNICYFCPAALSNKLIYRLTTAFEPRINPDIIFIIDIDPEEAQRRDNYSKSLEWLKATSKNYKASVHSQFLQKYNIQLLEKTMPYELKVKTILSYIENNLNHS